MFVCIVLRCHGCAVLCSCFRIPIKRLLWDSYWFPIGFLWFPIPTTKDVLCCWSALYFVLIVVQSIVVNVIAADAALVLLLLMMMVVVMMMVMAMVMVMVMMMVMEHVCFHQVTHCNVQPMRIAL